MVKNICRRITVTGIVQGVGFRPFIYNLARELNLDGTVSNTGRGVNIEVEGPPGPVEKFISRVQNKPPVLARVHRCDVQARPLQGYECFYIAGTSGSTSGESVVPPDTATCPECCGEIMNTADRHHRYPFTNCTVCGPRFTIVNNLPYDRRRTSMAGFTMCRRCEAEYKDPADRRFHAQPVACPQCGPRISLVDRRGKDVAGNWLEQSQRLLSTGKILAVKGLGGFHLACNATDPGAILRLRRRKGRPAKPLAVMGRDLETIRKYCLLSPGTETLLLSPAAPIVILERRPEGSLPAELGPGLNTLGVMLPYTPLHHLLFSEGLSVLVMTSGNRTGLPLVKNNLTALEQLGTIADYFLIHNRDIVNRCDDSVVKTRESNIFFFRRSRGYVPLPLTVPVPDAGGEPRVILGSGGDLKNTFCLLIAGRAYLSQHIGSLDTLEGQENWTRSLENFCRLVGAKPGAVAYDRHPEYQSARLARTLGRPGMAVQHHHGHMAACMAENGLQGNVIGIILDGTGYGPDGTIRGFEVLSGGYGDFTREIYLQSIPLPGGDRAVMNPWRTAVSYLITALGDEGLAIARDIFTGREREIEIIFKLIRGNFHAPPASSCGRLFDAVSALLGICPVNTYDGQAAIELGEIVSATRAENPDPYSFNLSGDTLETGPLLRDVIRDLHKKAPRELIARRFHDTVACMAVKGAEEVRTRRGLERVILSGGCWYNSYLLSAVCSMLEKRGFQVFTHRRVPTGDGGLSLGQAAVAAYNGDLFSPC